MAVDDVFKFLEGTDDAAFVVNADSEIYYWNAGARNLFGYSGKEVLGKSCYDALQSTGALGEPVCAGRFSLQYCAINGIEVPNFDLQVTTRLGGRIWVSVSMIVFYEASVSEHLIIHLAHEITKRKRTEDMLARIATASKALSSPVGKPTVESLPHSLLSEQERRILHLFARAKNSQQVARELGITLPTLRNHLHTINQKLGTDTRLEAVLHAIKRGFI